MKNTLNNLNMIFTTFAVVVWFLRMGLSMLMHSSLALKLVASVMLNRISMVSTTPTSPYIVKKCIS